VEKKRALYKYMQQNNRLQISRWEHLMKSLEG